MRYARVNTPEEEGGSLKRNPIQVQDSTEPSESEEESLQTSESEEIEEQEWPSENALLSEDAQMLPEMAPPPYKPIYAHKEKKFDAHISALAASIAKRMQIYASHRVEVLDHAHPSWWGSLTSVVQAVGISPASLFMEPYLHAKRNADTTINTIRSSYTDQKVHSVPQTASIKEAPMPILEGTNLPALKQRCAEALLAQAGICVPSAADFEGEEGRIAALSWKEAKHLCRMRALTFRRMAMRRTIDKASRIRFSQWLEGPVLDKLMQFPGAPQLEVLEHSFDLPALRTLNTTDLEWEGLHLLDRDGIWNINGPFAHLRLCFAKGLAAPPWIPATLNQAGQVDERFDPHGGKEVLALLEKMHTP